MNRRDFFRIAAGAAAATQCPVKLPDTTPKLQSLMTGSASNTIFIPAGQYLFTANVIVNSPRKWKQIHGITE